MKLKILHIILLFSICISFYGYAQEKTIQGYKIEGETIVFTFDKRDYEVVTNDKNQQRIDFDDFDIKSVFVSGNFNKWSRKNWRMKKVDTNLYQLRKKIADFDDDFNWEFKFIINNSLWAEITENALNITAAKTWFGKRLNTYNFKILPILISEKGNSKFFLKGFKNAEKVILAGTFNNWNEHLYQMIKTDEGWKLNLQLKPNCYQYKFIVDGEWMEDPANKNKVLNEHNSFNSILDIQKETTFLLDGFTDAEKVILAGSFNNWSENAYRMIRTENGWKYTTKLTGGKHHYKFIVDGNWKLDPKNSVKEYDGGGNVNSVKMIK
ncbi:hypothetical protein [uncultured Polaribacter sp.]|uniref:hypothetical protein n=1 Tax=uncultured Polaribacter sp. TaxID=174711 RepID=UPI002633A91A|nr:hypothetical protein [uncultured Polaribacter sp.]